MKLIQIPGKDVWLAADSIMSVEISRELPVWALTVQAVEHYTFTYETREAAVAVAQVIANAVSEAKP